MNEVIFPIKLTNGILGETVTLSWKEACLDLERFPVDSNTFYIRLPNLSLTQTLKIQFQTLWHKTKGNRVLTGVHFLKPLKEERFSILKDALLKYKFLNKKFIILTKNIRNFLQDTKYRFDEFDKIEPDEQRQIEFIEENKKQIFKKLDSHFNRIWEIVKNFDRENYRLHQIYYQQMFYDLFGPDIEINWYIYSKPLGYPGDYIMMNYIYDYHKGKYLGKSSFEKLINHYTCNIPISCSNIRRKEFFKEKILKIIEEKNNAKILSVGCGSCRELIELLNEGKISKHLLFTCLDFEKKTLNFVRNEIKKIEKKDKTKKRFLSVSYINKNIIEIIEDQKFGEKIEGQDLIYVSGLCDYLGDKTNSKLIKALFQILNKKGTLIVSNINAENCSHRAYYEFLGEWNMFHRNKEELLSWVRDFKDISEIKFENTSRDKYLFLTIKK